ncbi:MAG: ATP-dependent helicase [Spirochaetes bacterium]|nr:ATP-dependent helicase [Spirochaetota bacterium]
MEQLLTKIQDYAVKLIGKPILVIASAGSGKTRIIVEKIKYLLDNGYNKNKLVALTFTNKAADEIIKRITKEENQIFPYFSTFHSFCLKIMKEHPELFNINPDFTVIDDDDQEEIIKDLTSKIKINNKNNYLNDEIYSINYLIDKINFIKLDKIDFNKEKIVYKKLKFEKDNYVKTIFYEYENFLRKNNLFDFQDLLIFSLKGLINNNTSNFFKLKFEYILVDEYQDTNWIQKEILKNIYNGNNLLAVGDEDQAIYSFRGGDVNNILNFEVDFPNSEIIFMTENFRSGKNIINFANFIISQNKNRRKKELKNALNKEGEVNLVNTNTNYDDSYAIVFIIKNLINQNYKLSDIAILYRANFQSGLIEKALLEENISYIIYGAISFFKRKEVKIAFDFIAFILNQSSIYLFSKLININRIGIGPKKIEDFIHFAKKEGFVQDNSIVNYLIKYKKNSEFVNFGEKIIDLIQYYNSPVEFLIKLKDIFKLDEYFIKISKDEKEIEERKENYETLIKIALEFKNKLKSSTIKDFYEKFVLYSREKNSNDFNGVKLMTIHLAKGLEFPIVIISGATNGLLPLIRLKDIENADIEEERRLFYVASTRAKDILYITSYSLTNYSYEYIINKIQNTKKENLKIFLQNFGKPSLFLKGIENLNFVNFYFYNSKLNQLIKINNQLNLNKNNKIENNLSTKEILDININEDLIINHKNYGKLKIINIIEISKNIKIYECINNKGEKIKILIN